MSHINISDFRKGDAVQGKYILPNTEVKYARDGRTFLKGLLTDATGYMSCVCFNDNPEELAAFNGDIVKVQGKVYDKPEFRLCSIQIAKDVEDEDWTMLLPAAPVDRKQIKIERADWNFYYLFFFL